MSGLTTSLVRDKHGYTRADTPWILEDETTLRGRLVHYLSGGGMRTFGRTVSQQVARTKHRRFFVVAGCLAAIWAVFWVF